MVLVVIISYIIFQKKNGWDICDSLASVKLQLLKRIVDGFLCPALQRNQRNIVSQSRPSIGFHESTIWGGLQEMSLHSHGAEKFLIIYRRKDW